LVKWRLKSNGEKERDMDNQRNGERKG